MISQTIVAETISVLVAATFYLATLAASRRWRVYVADRRILARLAGGPLPGTSSGASQALSKMTGIWLSSPPGARFDGLAAKARLSGRHLSTRFGGLLLVVLAATPLITGSLLMTVSATVLVVVAIFAWLGEKARRMESRFREQLPETLDLISQALTSGASLSQALAHAGRHAQWPMNDELRLVVEQLSLGMSVEAALSDLETRLMLPELRMAVAAILIQRRAGGNLAALLTQTALLLRQRLKMKQDLLAQTAQARFSGKIMGLMPAAVAVVIGLIDPDFMRPLYSTSLGLVLLAVALLAELTGFLVIRKILQVRI